MAEIKAEGDGRYLQLTNFIIKTAVDGAGPIKPARVVADECLAHAAGDVEEAIERLIKTHVRRATVTGFVTSLGGLVTMPATLPADICGFYTMAGRCVAGIAYLRGYDLDSEEVRSVILVSLLGAAGAGLLAEMGVAIGTRGGVVALRKIPGRALIAVNQKVGFRLVTKFGQKGMINLVRYIPLLGGVIGAGSNLIGVRGIARYGKNNFPPLFKEGAAE